MGRDRLGESCGKINVRGDIWDDINGERDVTREMAREMGLDK